MKVAHRSFPDCDSNVRIVIDIVSENIPKDPNAPQSSVVKIQALDKKGDPIDFQNYSAIMGCGNYKAVLQWLSDHLPQLNALAHGRSHI
tara:strand:+ start:305 stop:571 length:267 start_codon:yes stop_codon:yes gene_type:complete